MNKLLAKKEGFTLIEIVLVLAIAGLILVVVFLAVGGANRANRDTTRTNEAGQIAAVIESYARNNNGTYPTTTLDTTYTTSIKDVDTGAAPTYSSSAATATSGENYSSGMICAVDGSGNPTGAMAVGTLRNYAISYWSEQAGKPTCKDNK